LRSPFALPLLPATHTFFSYGRALVGDDTVCFQVSAHLLPWCYLLFSCCAV
jgi:hypothetical protein